MTPRAFSPKFVVCAGLAVTGLIACTNSSFTAGTGTTRAAIGTSTGGDGTPGVTGPTDSTNPNGDPAVTIPVNHTAALPTIPGVDGTPTNAGLPVGTHCTVADPTIATVNPTTCQITAIKPGTTTVVATTPDNIGHTVAVTVTPISTDSGIATATEGTTASDAAIIAAIPGTTVTQLGVNFEDLGSHGDKDFNDSVMCFQGQFKVVVDASGLISSGVTSIAAQTITPSFTTLSACHHNLTITITNPDGTQQPPVTVDDSSPQALQLVFQIGSTLDVVMQTIESSCHSIGQYSDVLGPKDMNNDPVFAHVLLNQCNTTGN